MNLRLKEEISLLPDSPGVYLMKDIDEKIIYVGKAKNLKKRVSQYFLRPQNGKVAAMVFHVDHFDTIMTPSEKEALILEMNLIKKHYPRYNILLKDNSHYPYIALRKNTDPILKIARNTKDKNFIYFGPYPNASSAYQVIDLLNKIFPLRKCKVMPSVPCLYYHLGQCLAPCINKISDEDYLKLVNKIERFLKGYDDDIKKEITKKMLDASANLNYEMAKDYKEMLDAIEHVTAKQIVESKDKVARDAFAFASRDGYLGMAVMVFRRGLLLGKEFYALEQFDDPLEQMVDLIAQYYDHHDLPKEIVLRDREVANSLRDLMEVNILVPQRGEKMQIIEMVQLNASHGLDEHFLTARLNDDNRFLLEQLGQLLSIKTPYRIELFDNAHLQGSSPVGAMVCYINGEPVKKMYRKFHLEEQHGGDDAASMEEVVFRRYRRLVDEKLPLPDLIIVDGGIIQINAAKKALMRIEANINIAGLYKNEHHQTSGLMDQNGEVHPIDIRSPLFFLLMRMQDEVHRYAITFHRSTRSKSLFVSIFDGIAGLGKHRQETLRKNYPSLDDLRNASITELTQLLPEKVASALFKRIHDKN